MMFLAPGQQLIAVIKPPFDLIGSDSMTGTAQTDTEAFPESQQERKTRIHSPLLRHGGFYEVTGHNHSSFSYVLSMKLNSRGQGNCLVESLATLSTNRLWLEVKSILINVIPLFWGFKRFPIRILFPF